MTEYKLIPDGEKVRLEELDGGSLFSHGDTIAVKSEYMFCEDSAIEAVIVETGEFFWGGVRRAEDQRKLLIQPLRLVPVLQGKWVKRKTGVLVHWACSECGVSFLDDVGLEKLLYCPHCGTKMEEYKAE